MTPTVTTSPTTTRADLAARLLTLADVARRLPAPDHRRPEAFHEARSELAAALRALAAEAAR